MTFSRNQLIDSRLSITMSKIGFWILLTKFLATLNCDAQTIENEFNSEKLLSRHRRYLVFPEGSSLQLGKLNFLLNFFLIKPIVEFDVFFFLLVYDQIIGMVGSTNLHIFGITCALAWQLPHEIHKHPIEEHHDKTINLSSANKTTQRIDIPLKRIDFNHFTTYYNRKNYHNHQMNNSYYDYLWAKTKPEKLNRYYFGSNAKERWNYKHQIYPAPRMRRNIHSDKIHPEIKYFLKYHRNTRFDLYNSIEKYLNG